MFYSWPLKYLDRTHPRLGVLGEFRGTGTGDGVTILHSGTDIAESGGALLVFSCDVGLVRRHTAAVNGNPSAGGGPIRVGHFAYNHINNVYARPGSTYTVRPNVTVPIPANLPIYVQERRSRAYAPKPNVTNPRRDADFRSGRIPNDRPVVAYRKNGTDDYVKATIWPQNVPIGRGVGPTDLHCIYYESADGRYMDIRNIANCLEVWKNYRNSVKPKARDLKLYSQVGDNHIVDFDRRNNRGVVPPGGATLKVMAYSTFNSVCGIYQLEYRIHGERPDTGRVNMWKFHKPPPDSQAFTLVDQTLSEFNTPNNKRTYYKFTKARAGRINDRFHWEIEKINDWPDGHYFIQVWVKNIKKANGSGSAPDVNEKEYKAELDLGSRMIQGQLHRTIKVTKTFR